MIQSPAEQAAWLPPERLSPVVWTERYRILPAGISAEPGRFSFDRTPYWREICDTASDNSILEVVCVKPTQVGWSELQRSVLAWQIDQEPGPALFVMPSQEAARELVDERIRPLIESTPVIHGHLSPDPDENTKNYIRFDTMPLFTAWAGSPQSLATRPVRYVNLDEVDKYPPFSGREADPISLAKERTTTFGHRAKVFIGSTPTLRSGAIWRAFEAADDQRCYLVPCPHCGHRQRFVLPQLKWPETNSSDKARKAAQIERDNSAYFECSKCQGKIFDHHKMKMIQAGSWVSGHLQADGQWVQDTESKKSKRVGYWLNAFYSPWRSFSAIAAEFIRSQDDIGKLMNFKNSWLAEPFEDQVASVLVGDIKGLKSSAPMAKEVPDWAQLLIATVDVQSSEGKPYFYFVVRAWGPDYLSQLVDFGKVHSVEALSELLNRNYPGTSPDLEPVGISMMGIDAHYLTEMVYDFVATDARVFALVGSKPMDAAQVTIKTSAGSKERGIEKRTFDSNFYKNHHEFRRQNNKWLVNNCIDDDYCSQLAAEQKVVDHKTRRHIWVPRSQGIANHYLDCEVMQHVCADIAGVNLLVDESTVGESEESAPELVLGI